MINTLKELFSGIFEKLFSTDKTIRLGLYGPPNSGKTTLANRIIKDLVNSEEELGTVSNIAHETRKIGLKEKILITKSGKKLFIDLIDTPGIATRIDYEKFMKSGISEKESKQRAREATRGVIESIKWLDNVDVVLIVLDSTKNPYNQVNLTIIGNLEARKIPVIIIANKIDLKSSKADKLKSAFPKYPVLGISAKFAMNMDEFYEEIIRLRKLGKKR